MRHRRILLVDGDDATRAGIGAALRAEGYEIREERSVAAVEPAVVEFAPGLILLEATLPDGDGFDLARRLSERRSAPHLIFVTSRDRMDDKVAGLRYADDYLVKPVNQLELEARLRAILRRIPGSESTLRFSGILLNTETREGRRGGEPVFLAPA